MQSGYFSSAPPGFPPPSVGALLTAAEHVQVQAGGARDQSDKERVRVSKACDACSKRRAKCSGAHPCDRCAAKGLVCTFDRSVLSSHRSSKKRGPAKGSVMSVHKRLKALEELVLAKGVSPEALTRLGLDPIEGGGLDEVGDSQDGSEESGSGEDDTPRMDSYPIANPGSRRRHRDSRGKSPAVAIGQQSGGSGPALAPGMDPGGPLSPFSYSAIMSSASVPGVPVAAPYAASNPTPLPLPTLQPLPPQEVLNDLVRTWATQILPFAGTVHKPSFVRNPFSFPPQFLLSSYTFAAKLSNHPWINNAPTMSPDICGQIFYDHALRLLIPVLVGLQTPTVYDILAVVNAGMWSGSSTGMMGFAYRFLSFGVALAKEVGLNRETVVAGEQGWIAREHRRRVFWHLVMVDRVLSSAFNSEPLIPESEIQCDLPCLDVMWESDDSTLDRPTNIPIRRAIPALDDREALAALLGSPAAGPSAYMALLNVIFGRIIQRHCLHQNDEHGKRKLDMELDNWMASLPPRIRELRISPSEPLPTGRILDSRISHTLKILLHGPWDIQSMAKDTNWLLSPDFLVCAEHAEHISRTLEFIMKSSVAPDFLPPYLGLCILMAAFVHITLLRKLKGTGELEDDLRRRIMIYRSRWRPVTSVASVLRQAIGATDSGTELNSGANWESGGRGLFSLAELAQEKVEEEREHLGTASTSFMYPSNVEVDGAMMTALSGGIPGFEFL
ncbi:hypothetical protein M427DRAFT_27610 [Gonapodya prolifera JEL478]|uniref:Zn(2)-C6 fungal-type domain-containing protein n=1 Tax=Gonapodya prolifera (strain JEL478) TaxID=1344416 RepID=A0A139AWR1_GONPJ|nr:hypothetical protein M427DRAFT_27610 [Gonapodya prolifera JEL478]|eukprot:KXS21176.1 hypothetical protein M427DRAFT_27610 [Gonapodya prolifera JEL478]